MSEDRFLPKTKEKALSHLMEECAEVIQTGAKIQRFGWTKCNPYDPAKEKNKDALLREMADLLGAIRRMKDYLES